MQPSGRPANSYWVLTVHSDLLCREYALLDFAWFSNKVIIEAGHALTIGPRVMMLRVCWTMPTICEQVAGAAVSSLNSWSAFVQHAGTWQNLLLHWDGMPLGSEAYLGMYRLRWWPYHHMCDSTIPACDALCKARLFALAAPYWIHGISH